MNFIQQEFQEAAKKAVEILRTRRETGLPENQVINLCFDILDYHPDDIEKCRAAVILSGVIQKGFGKRLRIFLEANPELPERVHEILNANIRRMEAF